MRKLALLLIISLELLSWVNSFSQANDKGLTYHGQTTLMTNSLGNVVYGDQYGNKHNSVPLRELSVEATMTDHQRTMSNPLVQSIHQGHYDFWRHPVTKATVNTLLFVCTGGIEGVAGLASWGRSLFTGAAKGGRVFWSGGDDAMNAAMNYAKSKGGTTLEMTRAGQNLQNLITTRNIPWSEARPMWEKLSSVYARGANGTVHFFPGTTVNPGSIWLNIERPILINNGVKIITH